MAGTRSGRVLGTLAWRSGSDPEALGIRGTALAAAGLNLVRGRRRAVGTPAPRSSHQGRRPRRAAPWRDSRAASWRSSRGGFPGWGRFCWRSRWSGSASCCPSPRQRLDLRGDAGRGAAGNRSAASWRGLLRAPDRGPPLGGPLALLAALCVAVSYAPSSFRSVPPMGDEVLSTIAGYFRLALPLMLPVCLLSGMLFTLLGRALHGELRESTRPAGLLTLANTLGAATGALVGGFLLLPVLGVERSLFALCLYGPVCLLALAAGASASREPGRAGHGRGAVRRWSLPLPIRTDGKPVRPGIVSRWAAGLLSADRLREDRPHGDRDDHAPGGFRPESHRLITNGMAMSGTPRGRRYMALYVWWPVAVHPAPRRALQISYGLGTTTRALVETRAAGADRHRGHLGRRPAAQRAGAGEPVRQPAHDPRVHAHVEDGRFFLLTTPLRYDIITAEPPPPRPPASRACTRGSTSPSPVAPRSRRHHDVLAAGLPDERRGDAGDRRWLLCGLRRLFALDRPRPRVDTRGHARRAGAPPSAERFARPNGPGPGRRGGACARPGSTTPRSSGRCSWLTLRQLDAWCGGRRPARRRPSAGPARPWVGPGRRTEAAYREMQGA